MLNKAIIEKRIDFYTYKVRIPRYNKSNSSSFASNNNDLYTASVCILPGIHPCYDLNDVVFVMFENDELNKPVIIGKLYREEDNTESTSDIKCNSIETNEENKATNFYSMIEDNIDTVNDNLENINQEINSLGNAAYLAYRYDPETDTYDFYEPFDRLLDQDSNSLMNEKNKLLIR